MSRSLRPALAPVVFLLALTTGMATAPASAAVRMHGLTWSEQPDSVLFRMDFTDPIRAPKVFDRIREKNYFYVDFYGASGPDARQEWNLDKSFVRHVRRMFYPDQKVLRVVFYTKDDTPVRLDLSGLGSSYRLTARLLPRVSTFSAGSYRGEGKKLVVIDPGHGGDSLGAKTSRPVGGKTHYEKDLVLEIARRMVPLFEKTPNLECVLTRTDDRDVSLDDRIAFADRVKGDLFVSIHMNATDSRNKTAEGFEVYYLSDGARMTNRKLEAIENEGGREIDREISGGGNLKTVLSSLADDKFRERRKESVLASMVFDQIFRREGPFKQRSRGVKTAGFRVLMNYNMPSILVEVGFIDNPSEAARLVRPEVQQEIAELLFKSIDEYFARSDPDFRTVAAGR